VHASQLAAATVVQLHFSQTTLTTLTQLNLATTAAVCRHGTFYQVLRVLLSCPTSRCCCLSMA
jgi:hypothetical protein